MEFEYYQQVRKDALAVVPHQEKWGKVLEVGCGAGATLSYLKENKKADYVHGIEVQEGLPVQEGIDQYQNGDAESFDLNSLPEFDLILLLDVIEHLKEPFQFLRKVRSRLTGNKEIVISVPNINNIRILKNLILGDRWDYQDSGILDRTHLRFYTESSFRSALQQEIPELEIVKVKRNYEDLPLMGLLSKIPFLSKFFVCQLIFYIKDRK